MWCMRTPCTSLTIREVFDCTRLASFVRSSSRMRNGAPKSRLKQGSLMMGLLRYSGFACAGRQLGGAAGGSASLCMTSLGSASRCMTSLAGPRKCDWLEPERDWWSSAVGTGMLGLLFSRGVVLLFRGAASGGAARAKCSPPPGHHATARSPVELPHRRPAHGIARA